MKSRNFTKRQIRLRMDRQSKIDASNRGYEKIQALIDRGVKIQQRGK